MHVSSNTAGEIHLVADLLWVIGKEALLEWAVTHVFWEEKYITPQFVDPSTRFFHGFERSLPPREYGFREDLTL